MNWAFWFFVVLAAYNLGVAAAKHGQPQQDYDFDAAFVAACITIPLLYYVSVGGNPF